MTYWRKNRTTKNRIYLIHHNPCNLRSENVYWLECQAHGTKTSDYKQRSAALKDMAHPWEWCEQCKVELESAS